MTGGPIRVLELRSVLGTGGGPEKTILCGSERSNPDRYKVTVCYLRDARDAAFAIGARADCQGVDYVEMVERSSFDPRPWAALRQLVRARGIHIVHAHEYKTDLLALWLARTEGTIALATVHGWTGHLLRERFLYYPVDKRLLRAFPATIAVSSQIRAELLRSGVAPNRVHVVLNGIDHRGFRRDPCQARQARRRYGLGDNDVVIGSAGRLEPQKRFDLLIRMCAALRERWPSLRLLIAGEGSARAELETLSRRLMPRGSCTLLGHHADIVGLHHALDVYVQSSDYEGTPNTVLEAMALETPVVATAAGGTAEILRDRIDGLIVPVGDVQSLGNAVAQTLSHRQLTRARVDRARRRVESTLSFDARMAAVEEIYSDLMRTRASHVRTLVPEPCLPENS